MRLPDDLVKRAKRKAATEGRSLTSLIEEGFRRVVNDRKSASRSERVLPPVAKETGGLQPGLDLNDTAALQELHDLEYVRRL